MLFGLDQGHEGGTPLFGVHDVPGFLSDVVGVAMLPSVHNHLSKGNMFT